MYNFFLVMLMQFCSVLGGVIFHISFALLYLCETFRGNGLAGKTVDHHEFCNDLLNLIGNISLNFAES